MSYRHEVVSGGVEVIAENRDTRSAFADGAMGVLVIVANIDRVKPAQALDIVVEGKSLNDLYMSWLETVREFAEVNEMLFSEFEIKSIQKVNASQWLLTGEIMGEEIDKTRHEVKGDVKKLKFSKVSCKEGAEGVSCHVLVS